MIVTELLLKFQCSQKVVFCDRFVSVVAINMRLKLNNFEFSNVGVHVLLFQHVLIPTCNIETRVTNRQYVTRLEA